MRLWNSCYIPPPRCCARIPGVDEVRSLHTAWTMYQLAKYLETLWDEELWAEQRCSSGDVHWFIAVSWNVMGFSSMDQSPCSYLHCQPESVWEQWVLSAGCCNGQKWEAPGGREFQLLGLARWERPLVWAGMGMGLLGYLTHWIYIYFWWNANGP